MKKFENVDIVDSLRRIMNINTKQYKSDFIRDVDIIQAAALSNKSEDKRLMFLSRPSGTYCFRERDIYIKNTFSYAVWRYYGETTDDKILAYAVQIKGIEGDKIKGNLYELDYRAHFKHVIQAAVNADTQTLHYERGDIDVPASMRVKFQLHPKYGDLLNCELIPNNEEELNSVLRRERHGYEKLTLGDIDKHITALHKTALRERIANMSTAEKQDFIDMVETTRANGHGDTLSDETVKIYNRFVKQVKKSSIKQQLADGKTKSAKQPKKAKLQKKEDISL